MESPSSQRVALVTGGAARLGGAISEALAGAGYDLVVAYRSSSREARRLKARVEASGRSCHLVQVDLLEPEACAALVASAAEAYGRLDVIVNSAAFFEKRPLETVGAEEWDTVMALNVRAPHLIVRAAAPLLRSAHGSVINIVDLSALEAWPNYPDHSVSKAALLHLTRVQARALAPEVRVNAVAPGAVLPPAGGGPEDFDRLVRAAPLRSHGSPSDVTGAVLYLAGARFVTGQVIPVDGGRSLGANTEVQG